MLSKTERLILINQYEILRRLEEDESDLEFYSQSIKALEYGFEGEYARLMSRLHSHMSQADCSLTKDILWMFWMMEAAYDRCNPKPSVEEDEARFRGFDNNNEAMYCAYADHLRADGEFGFLKNRALNSHMPTLRRYTAMLRKWEELGRPNADDFPASQIEAVVNAGRSR